MIKKEDFLEEINCPVCGKNDKRILFPVSHRHSNVLELLGIGTGSDTLVEIAACNCCDHRYMTPVITDVLMDKYYSILNSEFYHNAGTPETNHNEKEYEDYSKIIKGLKPTGKILEVGCGNGYLLKKLETLGYECCGVEPSPMAFNYAKNSLKLNIENSFLANSSFYSQKFDVVILIDVAEHIINMQTFMKEITAVLKDGGIVFIGTGNIKSLNAKIAGPNWGYFLSWEHVSFFTKKSMTHMLEQNSFNNIKINETSLQHKPVQNFLEFIKNLAKKTVNPLLKNKYYHGICYDHFIVTAAYKKP